MGTYRRHGRSSEQESEASLSEARKCLIQLQENCIPDHNRPTDADTLVAIAVALARAGRCLENGDPDDECRKALEPEYRKIYPCFVAYLHATRTPTIMSSLREEHDFDGEELEILLTLAASSIGATNNIHDIDDLQKVFPSFRRSRMQTARMLLPENKLVMSGMIQLDQDESFKRSSITADPHFTEAILRGKEELSATWNCATQEELLKKLPLLRRMINKADEELDESSGDDFVTIQRKEKRDLDRFIGMFLRCIKPEWGLAAIFSPGMIAEEAIILLALLGGAVLGDVWKKYSFGVDYDEYSGNMLARAAANQPDDVGEIVRNHLSVSSRLLNEKLIMPILDGSGEMLEEEEDSIRNLRFQLTDECLAKIGVKRKCAKGTGGRRPLLRMEQLELSEEIRQALKLAVNQYECRDVLESWELGTTIPYGRAVSMLFYGPPGVGKTAAAEAIASTLNKRILVADYSQIQNCWVGETEKNIVKIFKKARESDCVLFWDEADAMFYDRETASHNWEVRDVNVLLQELEKFDGVCILSTNRRVELDKALARRISLKIEFKPPTREQAKAIWKKLLPKKLPLAKNVDFTKLCAHDLTGGEIKNVILNAARHAASRGRRAKLDMADFNWALATELSGKNLQGRGNRKLGF